MKISLSYHFTFLVVGGFCGLCNASGLSVYEPFDYPAGALLTNQEGGSGWHSGWTHDGASASVYTKGLSYFDLHGNKLEVSGMAASTEASSVTRSFRVVDSETLNDVWISFLWHQPESKALFYGVTFYQGNQTRFAVENPSTTTSGELYLVRRGQNITSLNNTGRGELGVTHLIVLRLIQGGGVDGNDLVEIFVDPLLSGIPVQADLSLVSDGNGFGFDTIRVAGEDGAALLFDEFRVGTTYASVTPHISGQSSAIDSDGDGLTDAQEAILGTDPLVSNKKLFDAVRTRPELFGLYSTEGVLEQSNGGIVVPAENGESVDFYFEIEQSDDLLNWFVIESIHRSVELSGGKKFLRIVLEDPLKP